MKPSPACAHAAPRLPTSSCSSLQPTTGVMPQTLEAIDHARAAEVPIIVAINKIDRPNRQPGSGPSSKLGEHDLAPEDWGGDTVTVQVSAKMKEGLDDLLEMIGLTAELLELQASASVPAKGTVLEAQLHRQRGAVATLLVREGTLRVGDHLVVGNASGKVRAMVDDRGDQMKETGPADAGGGVGLEQRSRGRRRVPGGRRRGHGPQGLGDPPGSAASGIARLRQSADARRPARAAAGWRGHRHAGTGKSRRFGFGGGPAPTPLPSCPETRST